MTLIAGAVLLGVLVFFHELGHFLVAKLFGVRVLTFSIGFGPRLFGIKRGDTDYRVSALPLGGYVRMYGDDIHEEVPEAERHRAFLHKPVLQKMAIAFAGPAANFLLPIAVFALALLGDQSTPAAVVGTLIPGEPAERAGLEEGDLIVSVDGREVRYFADLAEVIRARPGREVRLVVDRDGVEKTIDVIPRSKEATSPLEKGEIHGQIGIRPGRAQARVAPVEGSVAAAAGLYARDLVVAVDGEPVASGKELLALLDAAPTDVTIELTVERTASVKPDEDDGAVAANADDASAESDPARRTIRLPPADELQIPVLSEVTRYAVNRGELDLELNGAIARTRAQAELSTEALARRRGVGLFEGTIGEVSDGGTAQALGLKPGDRVLAVDGRRLAHAEQLQLTLDEDPDAPHVAAVLTKAGVVVSVFRQNRLTTRGLEDFRSFGAVLGTTFDWGPTVTRTFGPLESVGVAAEQTWNLIEKTAKGLWMLLTFQVSFSSLSGPIAIFSLAGQAMDAGAQQYIWLLCLISVNLGLINLLPVPVLDGGHLLLFTIEAIRRRELDLATKQRALKVGFSMLLLLMAAALFNDLMRLVG